jgi:hypothetical protein
MPKPTTLPRWASDVTAAITEPNEGQKNTGWVTAQRPPHQYFNWWMRLVYFWIQWLDGFLNEAHTWAAKHIFNAGLASSIAPTAGDDVANKTYVDGNFPLDAARHGAQTSGTLHAAATGAVAGFMAAADKTKLDAASSAPTATTLALRDAAGRAQFADPAAAQDAATKAYVDAQEVRSWNTGITAEPNWNSAAAQWSKLNGTVLLNGYFSAGANGLTGAMATLPSGARPPGPVLQTCARYDQSLGTYTPALILVGANGLIHLWNWNGAADQNDQVYVAGIIFRCD